LGIRPFLAEDFFIGVKKKFVGFNKRRERLTGGRAFLRKSSMTRGQVNKDQTSAVHRRTRRFVRSIGEAESKGGPGDRNEGASTPRRDRGHGEKGVAAGRTGEGLGAFQN